MCIFDREDQGERQKVIAFKQQEMEDAGSMNSSSAEDQGSVKSESLSPPPPNSKIKIMCSYGGRILPRPHDGNLRYVGGETRILLWQRNISFGEMMAKLVAMVGRNVAVKYQLPNEDLDALISVVCEEDFGSMIDEYFRMEGRDSSARLRLFLFFIPIPAPPSQRSAPQGESRSLDQQYIEAVNGMAIGSTALAAPSRPSRPVDEDFECGAAKPGPIKMHRQLSASDRIWDCGSRRVSPRTSPKAHDECSSRLSTPSSSRAVHQQDFHEPCKPMPVPSRENSAGRIPQEMIDPVVVHHYYPSADSCQRQQQQQSHQAHHFNAAEPSPPPAASDIPIPKVVPHDGESPKKLDQHHQEAGIHAANGFLCMNPAGTLRDHATTWCQGTEVVVNRQYQAHHRHANINLPVPAICEQQLYPVVATATACCCRETRASSKPSPSRFRDEVQQQQSQQQQQVFHEQVVDDNRMLVRPVLVPQHQQQHHPQHHHQQVYEASHHHHRLVAEKNGARLSDLERRHHLTHQHQPQQQQSQQQQQQQQQQQNN